MILREKKKVKSKLKCIADNTNTKSRNQKQTKNENIELSMAMDFFEISSDEDYCNESLDGLEDDMEMMRSSFPPVY